MLPPSCLPFQPTVHDACLYKDAGQREVYTLERVSASEQCQKWHANVVGMHSGECKSGHSLTAFPPYRSYCSLQMRHANGNAYPHTGNPQPTALHARAGLPIVCQSPLTNTNRRITSSSIYIVRTKLWSHFKQQGRAGPTSPSEERVRLNHAAHHNDLDNTNTR